jgi:hypothetical protein
MEPGYKCRPRRPKAARRTGERFLGFAISLVSKAALRATPAGVARIDGNDRDTRESPAL